MITKKTVLDQVEIRPDGIVQARFVKQLVEDGNVLAAEYHRTSIPPGVDVDEQMRAVNAQLEAMGAAPCTDYAQLKKHAAIAHAAAAKAAS